MKNVLISCLFFIGINLYSQNNAYVGQYSLKLGEEEHQIEYSLTLNEDGSFNFHSFSNNQKGIPPIVHTYGKGKWISNEGIISFYTEESEIDEEYTLDFTGTKARFISKSPRDKTTRVIKTRLKFYESGIFWVEGLDIFKI